MIANTNTIKSGTRDIHSPANFAPESYDYLGDVFLGPLPTEVCMAIAFAADTKTDPDCIRKMIDNFRNQPLIDRALATGVKKRNGKGRANCDHCGAHFHYGNCFLHRATGDILIVGHICADEAFGEDSRRSYDRKRRERMIAGVRKRGRAANKAAEFLAAHDGLEEALNFDHETSRDLKSSLIKFGSLTEAQLKLALGLPVWEKERATRRAEREAEKAAAPHWDADPGRVTVEGTLVSTKTDEFDPYGRTRGLVKLDDGRTVWGTIPSALLDAEVKRGDRVRFDAKLKRADDDPTHAWFSRPTKAEILEVV